VTKYWVIDSKAKILPHSTYEQDGSDWYYGRSVVPANSVEAAIDLLKMALRDKHVELDCLLAVIEFGHQKWESEKDELYETLESYEKAVQTNEVVTGVFASSSYLEGE